MIDAVVYTLAAAAILAIGYVVSMAILDDIERRHQ